MTIEGIVFWNDLIKQAKTWLRKLDPDKKTSFNTGYLGRTVNETITFTDYLIYKKKWNMWETGKEGVGIKHGRVSISRSGR